MCAKTTHVSTCNAKNNEIPGVLNDAGSKNNCWHAQSLLCSSCLTQTVVVFISNNRSTRAAFRPETGKPRSRNSACSCFTVRSCRFVRIALALSNGLDGSDRFTARAGSEMCKKCRKHQTAGRNSFQPRDRLCRWPPMAISAKTRKTDLNIGWLWQSRTQWQLRLPSRPQDTFIVKSLLSMGRGKANYICHRIIFSDFENSTCSCEIIMFLYIWVLTSFCAF